MCCICLIEKGNYITLDCSHKIHKSCLKILLNYSNKCPMCRSQIFKETICDCPIFSPYINAGECRYCFGIHKREFVKKYYDILKN
jgi:hypothetical protein